MTNVERLVSAAKRVIETRHHSRLTPASFLFEENFVDSFVIIQLVSEIEKEFAITVRTEDLIVQNFATIDDIAAFVKRRQMAAT